MPSKQGWVIKEKRPDGKGSVRETVRWMENISKTVLDSKSLFNVLIPDIKKSLKYEFSDANPNHWKPLSGKYLQWKRKRGFPDTIGIRTNGLKTSLTSKAKIQMLKNRLAYSFDPNVPGDVARKPDEKVGDYAKFFHKVRPIFGATVRFLNNKIKKIALRTWRLKNITGK